MWPFLIAYSTYAAIAKEKRREVREKKGGGEEEGVPMA